MNLELSYNNMCLKIDKIIKLNETCDISLIYLPWFYLILLVFRCWDNFFLIWTDYFDVIMTNTLKAFPLSS